MNPPPKPAVEDPIDSFLDAGLYIKPMTRKNYRNCINYFCRFTARLPTVYQTLPLPDIEKDLEGYFNALVQEHPILSTASYIAPVKQYLIYCNKETKALDFWDKLAKRTKGQEPNSDKAKLNRNDLREILNHGDIRAKALYLMQISSGRRIGEILALKPDDVHIYGVDEEGKPKLLDLAWLNIKKSTSDKQRTKTGQKTKAYISYEARDYYLAYMRVRDDYVQRASKRVYHSDPTDQRVFPIGYCTANQIWLTMLIKAKKVEYVKKGRSRFAKREHRYQQTEERTHCNRAFFRTYLGDPDLAEFLMGHGNKMTRAYRNMADEDIQKRYKELMPNITIFESTTNEQIQENLASIREENKQLRSEMEQLKVLLMFKKDLEGMINSKK
jgi:integrase